MKEFHQPPPEFAALDRDDLESLYRVLVKLSPAARPATVDARRPNRR
jgi:hypothetical protein